ncbi:MAG: hypothetical protein EOO41_03095, partial [Methanobacteriota archaeon]
MRQRYGGLPADEESGEKPTRVSSNRAAYEAGLAKVALRSSTATKLAVFTRNLSSALSPQVSVLYNRVGLLWATLVGVSVVLAVWLLLVSPLSTSNADFVAPLAPDFCYNCATAAPQPAQPFTLPMNVLVLSACGRGIVRDTVRQTWAASAAERSVAVRFVVGVPHTDAACKAALAQENESFPGSIIAVNVDANGVASLMSLAGGAAPGADAADASRAAAAAAFAPRRPAVDVQMSSSVLLAALTTLQAPGAVLLAPDDVYVHMSALRGSCSAATGACHPLRTACARMQARASHASWTSCAHTAAQLAAFDAPSVPTRFSTALKSEMSIIARFTPTSSPAEAARVSRVADTFPAVAGAPTNYTALPFAMLPQSMRQPSIVSNCVLLSSAVRNYIVSMSASLASASSDRWEHAIITWLAHLQVVRLILPCRAPFLSPPLKRAHGAVPTSHARCHDPCRTVFMPWA